MKIAVVGVQQPAARGLDRDAGVAGGVAAQRHQQDARIERIERAHAGEPEPGFAAVVERRDLLRRRQLRRYVARTGVAARHRELARTESPGPRSRHWR